LLLLAKGKLNFRSTIVFFDYKYLAKRGRLQRQVDKGISD
jgi:hypothetical protein